MVGTSPRATLACESIRLWYSKHAPLGIVNKGMSIPTAPHKTTPIPISEQNKIAIQRIGLGNVYYTLKRHYRRDSIVCLKYGRFKFEALFLQNPSNFFKRKNSWFISLILLFEMSANDRWAWTSSGKNVAEQFPGQEQYLLTNRVNISVDVSETSIQLGWSILRATWKLFVFFWLVWKM